MPRKYQRSVKSYRAFAKMANDIASSYLGASSTNKTTKRFIRYERVKRLSKPKSKRKRKKK
jgi:hypothetical protein